MIVSQYSILVEALTPDAKAHWEDTEAQRQEFDVKACVCYLCNTLTASKARQKPSQTQSGQGDPSGGNPYTGPNRVDLSALAEYARRDDMADLRSGWRKEAIAEKGHRCVWSDRFMATDAALSSELKANERLTRQVGRLASSLSATRGELQVAEDKLERLRQR